MVWSRRLRVLPFDPRWNFASILMSEIFFKLKKKSIDPNVKKYFRKLTKKVGNFHFPKNIFWWNVFRRKKSEKIWKFSKTKKNVGIFKKISDFSRNFPKKKVWYFWIARKYIFFGKVGKYFGHQDRSKISSRIEWEHSQPQKSTPNHCLRLLLCRRQIVNFFVLYDIIRPPVSWTPCVVHSKITEIH